jgi:hypothetical protein
MYKRCGDISNQTDGGRPSSSLDLEERRDSDHEILVTVALLNPEARYQVWTRSLPPSCDSFVPPSDHSEPLLPSQHTLHLSPTREAVLSLGARQTRALVGHPTSARHLPHPSAQRPHFGRGHPRTLSDWKKSTPLGEAPA